MELNGKYYQTYKEIGDQVKAGDVLLEFDLEEITKAGYDVTTPIVITNLGDYKITKVFDRTTSKSRGRGDTVNKTITKMSN